MIATKQSSTIQLELPNIIIFMLTWRSRVQTVPDYIISQLIDTDTFWPLANAKYKDLVWLGDTERQMSF